MKKVLSIVLTLALLLTALPLALGMTASAATEANHGLYIDTTGCSDHTIITLEKAVYGQPAGEGANYTVSFDYYTEASAGNTQLNARTSGNVGQSSADLYCKNFAQGEWLEYSSVIQNQKNTAIMIQIYVWPGFKGYIDNIVLTDSNGNVSMALDFDKNTTNINKVENDANGKAEIKECPVVVKKDNALYVDTTGCSNHTIITLEKAVYDQPAGEGVNYTVKFDYFTLESGANTQLNARVAGNNGQSTADLYCKEFKPDKWLEYSSVIKNQKNTALQFQIYVWPGFKGYIDNIVLTDSNGNVSMALDFDKNTTNINKVENDANAKAEIKDRSGLVEYKSAVL